MTSSLPSPRDCLENFSCVWLKKRIARRVMKSGWAFFGGHFYETISWYPLNAFLKIEGHWLWILGELVLLTTFTFSCSRHDCRCFTLRLWMLHFDVLLHCYGKGKKSANVRTSQLLYLRDKETERENMSNYQRNVKRMKVSFWRNCDSLSVGKRNAKICCQTSCWGLPQ